MYNGYTESAAKIAARKARITSTTQTKIRIKSPFFDALALASRLLQAKLIRDERNKKLCVCLQYIGDNGPCPVHGEVVRRERR